MLGNLKVEGNLKEDKETGRLYVDELNENDEMILPIYWKNVGKLPAFNIEAAYSRGNLKNIPIEPPNNISDLIPGVPMSSTPFINLKDVLEKEKSFKVVILLKFNGYEEIDKKTYSSELILNFEKDKDRFYLRPSKLKFGFVDGGQS